MARTIEEEMLLSLKIWIPLKTSYDDFMRQEKVIQDKLQELRSQMSTIQSVLYANQGIKAALRP